ncbi:MAG TPA: CAP domain-containing protein [Solirubrobacteraceae bacterium]|jgi:uncharacterized protein YkwD
MNRHHRLALTAVLMALACPSAASATSTGNCSGARLQPKRSNLETVTNATICLINRARAAHGLKALLPNGALDKSAQSESHDMRVDHYFGHDSPTGLTPRQQVLASPYGQGVSDVAAAQSIAWGEGSESTPREIVIAWMASPSHRVLLLGKSYRDVGVGVSLGNPHGSRDAIYTLDLASRKGKP